MPRVDFSEMREWNLMYEIWQIDILLGNGVSHMPDEVFDEMMIEQEELIDRLRDKLDEDDMQMFLLSLPGTEIMLKRLRKVGP